MNRILTAFGLVLALGITAVAQKGTDILATIGTKKITLDEFNKKYSEVLSQTLSGAPTKRVFLEDLIRY